MANEKTRRFTKREFDLVMYALAVGVELGGRGSKYAAGRALFSGNEKTREVTLYGYGPGDDEWTGAFEFDSLQGLIEADQELEFLLGMKEEDST